MNVSKHIAKAHALPDTPSRLLQLPLPVPDLPSSFTLELTTACPQSCSGCANLDMEHRKDITPGRPVYLDSWRTILDRIAPHARIVRLSGGEPTMHPHFFSIIQEIERRGIPHALLSTGRWPEKKITQILECYRSCNHFVGMLISLHGSTARSHNEFAESTETGFAKIVRNIRLSANAGLLVYTNAVLTRWVCGEIRKTVEHAMELGARYVLFNRFLGNPHPSEPSERQLRCAIDEIEALRLQGYPCRVGNNVPPCFAPNASEGAHAGYELCHISPTGKVRPDNLTSLHFGNILQQDLRSLWHSAVAELYRLSFPPTCQTCAAFSSCRGGAKSVTLEYGLAQDRLMKHPLSAFDFPPGEDPDKRNLAYLALTSD